MITLKEWMEIVEYRITEGSGYTWRCYGPDAYCLDSWNGDQDGHSLTIIFDNRTQEVYEVAAHDYLNGRAYRLVNPDYVDAHKAEAASRGCGISEAWEDVNYVDLDVDDDFIQKALSIVAGEDYDTRVVVPLDLDRDTMFELMQQAHAQDITLNELVERILTDVIDRHHNG
jgi:hypothetical protein